MNKEEFLKTLSKKLEILEEKERADTIDEYRDTIEEKMRNGQTEEEAVSDFGSVDELAKEILSAYKINPNYGKDPAFFEKGEKLIKKGAKKLANFTEGIVSDVKDSDPDITLEKIFEILLRVFIVLIILAVLRLPFELIESLGSSILSLGYEPAEWFFGTIFRIILHIIYFVVCILVLTITIKKSLGKTSGYSKKKEVVKVEEEKEYEEAEKVIDKKGHPLFTILKCFFSIFFLFPLSFVCIGLLCGLSALIVFCFQGFPFLGITILVLGIFLLMLSFLNTIWNLSFGSRRPHFSSIFFSFIFITIGGILTIQTFLDLEYYDSVPENTFQQDVKVYQEKLEGNIYLPYSEVHIDNTLQDNEYRMEVYYYPQFIDIYYPHEENSDYVYFLKMYNQNIEHHRQVYHLVMDGLKDKKVYRYHDFYTYKVLVYTNENTQKYIISY